MFAPADCPIIAWEECRQRKRKTANGEDILFAMTLLECGSYVEEQYINDRKMWMWEMNDKNMWKWEMDDRKMWMWEMNDKNMWKWEMDSRNIWTWEMKLTDIFPSCITGGRNLSTTTTYDLEGKALAVGLVS